MLVHVHVIVHTVLHTTIFTLRVHTKTLIRVTTYSRVVGRMFELNVYYVLTVTTIVLFLFWNNISSTVHIAIFHPSTILRKSRRKDILNISYLVCFTNFILAKHLL